MATKTRFNIQINGENNYWVNKQGFAWEISKRFSKKPAIKALAMEAAFLGTCWWEEVPGIGFCRIETDEIEWDELNNRPLTTAGYLRNGDELYPPR